ncbi:mitochondrial adenylate kinase [Andalucia godoyi]|uniref:Adenylate kinase isoenzyme 6 homolog n=1 Tax=Andalucia godoyi TaxID=505711 RepID=A0A8K0AJA3_ANDGO|nr:mitochondrial adenylate kinase [Andalucia godoyi]|eukprot:ANDGO_02313.mRNA.1 mitochondrial adenylate kinase
MTRLRPNILVTGTPGTGKSTLASSLATVLSQHASAASSSLRDDWFEHIDIAKLVKERKFYEEYDEVLDTLVMDEDALLDHLEDYLGTGIRESGGAILDSHACDLFPERWIDIVVVLTCSTESLFDRLSRRGYSDRKRTENIECEIMGVLVEEAQESYDAEIVHVLESNSIEDMDRNTEVVKQIVQQWIDSRSS